eukprot:5869061-Pyramimonas_sp.AAC.1
MCIRDSFKETLTAITPYVQQGAGSSAAMGHGGPMSFSTSMGGNPMEQMAQLMGGAMMNAMQSAF